MMQDSLKVSFYDSKAEELKELCWTDKEVAILESSLLSASHKRNLYSVTKSFH